MDFARRMEASGVFVRVDREVEATMFRGATISQPELDALRQIEQVVRLGYVRRIGTTTLALTGGEVASNRDDVYVDCTAAGLGTPRSRPVFEDDRITLQLVTIGIAPLSTATIGTIEALRAGATDDEKNALTPPVVFNGETADIFTLAHAGMTGMMRRSAESDITAWFEACRLNPALGAMNHLDDPLVADALSTLGTNIGAAMETLDRAVAVPSPS
jgi:hypothetical protein